MTPEFGFLKIKKNNFELKTILKNGYQSKNNMKNIDNNYSLGGASRFYPNGILMDMQNNVLKWECDQRWVSELKASHYVNPIGGEYIISKNGIALILNP